MIDRIRNLNLESLSFWIGFMAATVFWWLVTRLFPYFKKLVASLKESLITARESLQTGAEQRLRASTLKFVQSLHLASPLFALDEIVIPPQLLAPPVMFVPGQEPPLDYVVENIIPFMPEFPELAGAYSGHTIPIEKVLLGGTNLIITGKPGSGKTTALAYLASKLARRDPTLEDLQDHLPIFLHTNELKLPVENGTPFLDPIIAALTARSSALGQARLPEALKLAFRDQRVILLIDGYDEITTEAAQTATDYLAEILQEYPETRLVVTADPQFVDGLVNLGLVPIPMAAWNRRHQAQFIQQWSNLWKRFVQLASSDSIAIDPILLNGWLLNDNAALNPLEFTLKVWSVYAGDARGPKGTDAIEAYLRRMSVGITKARSALEYISTQMIVTMRSSFTQAEAQKWTSSFDSDAVEGAGLAMVSDTEIKSDSREITIPRVLSDLTRNGLLISRPGNQLGVVHPLIASYLAGTSLAYSGQGSAILSQPDWPLKKYTLHYLASQSDLSSMVAQMLTDTEDPLFRGILTVGSWLRDIPSDTEWRKPILQHLVNVLQQDALPLSFRARALACLAITNDPGVATIFRHLLRSPKDSVVQLAAIGCGFMRDSQAVADLSKLLGDPTRTGQAICLALVNIGTKPALEIAATILLQGEEMLRRAVAEAFAHHPEEGHPTLREGSTMDDLLVRRSVINGLRLVEEPWALKILEEIQIEDGQWVVRNAAAQMVEELHDLDPYIPRPLQPLETLPWLVEFASKRGTGISEGEPARAMLATVLREGSSDESLAALDYYCRLGDERIFPAIYHRLYGDDREIAESAYNTIWHLASTGAKIPPPIQFGLGY